MWIYFLTLFVVHAEVTAPNVIEDKDQILKKIREADTSDVDAFAKIVYQARISGERFVETKKQQCSGQYSVLNVTQEGVSNEERKDLSAEEKEACFLELKGFEIRITEEIFKQREKILKNLHQQQLQQLQTTKNAIIAGLEENYQKAARDKAKSRRK
ncbi:MAG: hypothetical protein JNM93_13495 [Bacteriovoracaceae bacterium]|nr:hypothetical protein [Bacteriovoracaceae bacterium]